MAHERQFGPYRLLQQLATGGMAEIYLAKTKGIFGFEKFVALKMIHPNYSADEHFVQMLVDEAKITVQLAHVNIAQVFDLGRVGDSFYITMEYIDGADLYRILRRAAEKDVEVPLDVAVHIAKEVCMGLDYAHKKKDAAGRPLEIIHRDISPQNVLVSTSAEVKVVDFGIAKAAMRSKQTAVGVIKGKYYYMSPEQAWAEPLDHRTDVFSTGILIYEMLIGQMLYLEEDVQRLLNMVRRADIPPPSTRRKGVPPALDAIIMKALAKKRDQRYASARDFGTDLERFLHTTYPDFTTARVAAFYQTIMGGTPEVAPPVVEVEVPEEETSTDAGPSRLSRLSLMSRSEFTDENSVIFSMAELAGAPQPTRSSLRATTPPPGRRTPPPAPRASTPPPSRATTPVSAAQPAAPRIPPRPITRPTTPASPRGFDEPTRANPSIGGGRPLRPLTPLPDDGETRVDGPSLASVGSEREEATMVAARSAPRGRETPEALADDPALDEATRVSSGGHGRGQPLTDEHTRVDSLGEPVAAGGHYGHPADQLDDGHVDDGESGEHAAIHDDEDTDAGAAQQGEHGAEATRLDFVPLPSDDAPHDARAPRTARRLEPDLVGIHASVRDANVPSPAVSQLITPRPSRRTPAQGVPITNPFPVAPVSAAPAEPWASPYASVDPALADVDVRTGRRTVVIWAIGALLVTGIIAGVVAMVRSSSQTVATGATIEIISIPSGATVRADGVLLPGVTPLRLDVAAPGRTYKLSVELPHYEPWSRDEQVPAGARQVKVIASLRPVLGTLEVGSTPPGAEVFLNNRSVGRTPVSLNDVDPFIESRVEVRLRGHKPLVQPVTWSADHKAQLSFKLQPTQ